MQVKSKKSDINELLDDVKSSRESTAHNEENELDFNDIDDLLDDGAFDQNDNGGGIIHMSQGPYKYGEMDGKQPMCTQFIMNQLEGTIEEMQNSQDSSVLTLLKPTRFDQFRTKQKKNLPPDDNLDNLSLSPPALSSENLIEEDEDDFLLDTVID